ncbi:MAG: TIGR01777 family oxidoreductase [Sedimentisphaerales bacterium]|nr:TIGR01777 family oxidoreductase [Sedimentisphaerales bacterium]
MESVVITGATGFIGSALCKELCQDYKVIALSRDVRRASQLIGEFTEVLEWDGRTTGTWIRRADGAFAVINLAGDNLASGKWNQYKKAGILHSRLDTTRAIIAAIKQVDKKPSVVIQSSAVGYYGSSGLEKLNEQSPPGKGFLADVCRKVEICTEQIENLGVRPVVIRTGVVLGSGGGALQKLAGAYKFFLGGHPGSGKQWFSWISMHDMVAAIRFLIENENQKGVFNLTSPKPVTMKKFCKSLGRVLHRPSLFRVPGFILRLKFGEMADEMLLSGQRVIPERLLDAGFRFEYPEIEQALKAVFSRKE